MKHRNLLTTVLLGYVTLGIYSLFWLYDTRKGLVAKLGDKKAIPPLSIIFLPYAVMLLLIVLAVAFNGETFANILVIVVGILAVIALPVILIYWFYKYSIALHKVTQGQDPILHLVLMIIMWSVGLGPVWVLLAQSDINKYLEAGGAAPATQPDPPYPQVEPALPTPQPSAEQPAADQKPDKPSGSNPV